MMEAFQAFKHCLDSHNRPIIQLHLTCINEQIEASRPWAYRRILELARERQSSSNGNPSTFNTGRPRLELKTARIIRLFNAGLTANEMAVRLGCSPRTVQYRLQGLNLRRNRRRAEASNED
jgi:DNA-binding CsgD family transcriptional regulator